MNIPGLSDEDNAAFARAFAELGVTPPEGMPIEYTYVPDRVSDEPVKEEPGAIQNSGVIVEGDAVLVPHMSPEELEHNTPSRGKNLVMIKSPVGVSVATFYLLLSNAYALYVTEGAYSNEALQARTGLAEGVISKTLSSAEFQRALRLRGVEPNATGLTTKQNYLLLLLSDPSDGKTLQQKLRAAGVSNATYRGWLKNSIFKATLDRMTGDLLTNNADSLVQLERLASSGDLGAIKYKHELNGTYDPNKQNNIDAMALMSLLFEVVSKYAPKESLAPIAQELGEIAQRLKLGPKQIGQ